MLNRSTRSGFMLFGAVCLAAVGAFAQSERGTISGTVHDATGAVVPGVQITATAMSTNVSVTLSTNGAGDYTIPSLPVGTYRIRGQKEGFRPAEVTGLTVNAATTVRADLTLQVGGTQQAIEVQATAAQLQTEDAKVSSQVTNRMVDELPLVVGGALRSPFDLAATTPEAKNIGAVPTPGGSSDYGFALGGGQAASYQATLDGITANTGRALQLSWVSSNAPSLEAVTEFTVDTNGFKAEYGHAGGGVMTFVSKSGTNDFHGTAYEFLRNNDFDANYFFSNQRGIPRQIYKQSDFGASAGGPVLIPKIYNGKNKTFFFFAYEGFRNRVGATAASGTIPTPEMYNGDFSKWVNAAGQLIPIYDPTSQVTASNGTVTRVPFAGNQIPKNLFDPLAVKALGVFQNGGGVLMPNVSATPGTAAYVTNNYVIANGSNVNPINKWSIKGDQIFSEKDRISGYYGYDRESTVPGADGPPTLPGFYTNYNDLQQDTDVGRFSWDHTFGPTKFNHFYAGGNNWRQNHNPPQEYLGNWKSKICLPNVPDCDQNLVVLNFSNGYSTWGGNANNGSENPAYAFNDDFTWVHGRHTIKFGGMYQFTYYNGFGRQCVSGCANFNFTETGLPGNTNFAQAGGNPFASFLLGWADNGQIDTVRYIGQHWPYFAGYLQDDWRVNSKLTVNFGLRWETQLPPSAENGEFSDFSPTLPNPNANGILGALLFEGDGPGRQGPTLADSYYRAFGPRFGFAYALNDKTAIRGGYGLSYSQIQTVTGSTHQAGFTLTQTFPDTSNGIQPSFIFSQGIPPWTAPPFINPSVANGATAYWWQGREATRPPEENNFNLSIQRQLSSSMVLDVEYNGVVGSHLQAGLLNYNQINPAYVNRYGTTLLTSSITSPAAVAAGLAPPFANFVSLWGSRATVAQALRPYPQYNAIDTDTGGGDHSGHSTYHAGIVKLQKRYASGLTFQGSYVFSKVLTDSDSYWPSSLGGVDSYNRKLEKSIGLFDVTHDFKFTGVYELPFGRGKPWLTHGFASYVLGNWRVSSINIYTSGTPVALSTTYSLPIFAGASRPYITSYNGWQPSFSGSFDPGSDHFFVPYGNGPFPLQGAGTPYNGIGNSTRYNPKVRYFPNLNENMSLSKSFPIKEQIRIDFRAEAFNIFNRVRFSTGSTQLQSQTFGVLTSNGDILNTPRQLQLALKLYF